MLSLWAMTAKVCRFLSSACDSTSRKLSKRRLTRCGDMVLERNEDYFDGPKGHPAIKTVIMKTVLDSETAIAELMVGQVDWVTSLTQDAVALDIAADRERDYLGAGIGDANEVKRARRTECIWHWEPQSGRPRNTVEAGTLRPASLPC